MTDNQYADLARTLGELAVEMQSKHDAEAVLQAITFAAVGVVPGVRWAGISLIDGKVIEPRVPTHTVVTKIDTLQSETGQGPCLSALREHETVYIGDMATEERWPVFAAAAVKLGIRTSLSCRLFIKSDNIGALNLYGGEPGVLDKESFFYGELLAQHASVALAGAQSEIQFQRALSSRDLIGKAKGIIMERFGVDEVRAFALLSRLSQQSNTKLIDVAKSIVEKR